MRRTPLLLRTIALKPRPTPSEPGRPSHNYTPQELERIQKRRSQSSESNERMAISRSLETNKVTQGGFTRPRSLTVFRRFPGGLRSDPKRYVEPPSEAYMPQTIILGTTRYPRRHPPGRAVQKMSYTISNSMAQLNSLGAPTEYFDEMENAVWPWRLNFRLAKKLHLPFDPTVQPPPALPLPPYPQNQGLALPSIWNRALDPGSQCRSYLPLLKDSPFFVPLLSVTLPTRPIADVVLRLSKGLRGGTAFYAVVPNEERKDGDSFHRRMLRMRIDRLYGLVGDLKSKLDGERGGLPGIRFHQSDRGYGVDGERLDTGIEDENKRIIVRFNESGFALENIDLAGEEERWASISCVEIGRIDDHARAVVDGKAEEGELGKRDEYDTLTLLEYWKERAEEEAKSLIGGSGLGAIKEGGSHKVQDHSMQWAEDQPEREARVSGRL